MNFLNRSVLGLDIGSHSIKLVELKKARERPTITCAKAVSIDHEGEVTNADISKSLGKLLDMSDVRTKRVITAVSSSAEEQVIMQSIFIEGMTADRSEEEVGSAVRFEAQDQDYIPYGIDYAQMSYDVIGEATVDDEQGLEVFFVSAHRDLIEKRIRLLKEVGLVPFAIDIDILAIARLLGFTDGLCCLKGKLPEAERQPAGLTGHDDEDIAIIDIGASKTSLCFYQNGKPYLYPHIPIAGDALTTELSQQLQVSWKEAEEYKRLQGDFKSSSETESGAKYDGNETSTVPSLSRGLKSGVESREYSSDEVFEVLQSTLEKSGGLCPQLQNRFEYYEADFERPSKIIVSGGSSQLASLDSFLSSRLSVPVERISYLEKIPVGLNVDMSKIEGAEPLFATALGLALKSEL